jgi:hypothetical protein
VGACGSVERGEGEDSVEEAKPVHLRLGAVGTAGRRRLGRQAGRRRHHAQGGIEGEASACVSGGRESERRGGVGRVEVLTRARPSLVGRFGPVGPSGLSPTRFLTHFCIFCFKENHLKVK